jgi:hypothetical protein
MANINLAMNQTNKADGRKNGASTGVIINLLLLLAVAGVAIYLIMAEKNLKKKIVLVEEEYEQAYKGLTEGRNMDVIDLQSRIFKLQEVVSERNSVLDAIQNVEKYLAAGVMVKNFSYDKEDGTIKLDCLADNHETVAKQVASFKELQYFSDVMLASVKTEATGGAGFTLSILTK